MCQSVQGCPDQSLIPQVVSLVGFGTALAFGWLIHRQPELIGVWAKQWPFNLAAAAIATGVCLRIAGLAPTFVPVAPGWTKLVYAASYALAIWCWSFAVLGVAEQFFDAVADRRFQARRLDEAKHPPAHRFVAFHDADHARPRLDPWRRR